MVLKRIVISLGGSRIIPDNVDSDFLIKFKKLIDKYADTKFVVVTGGGTTARKYINAYKTLHKGFTKQSSAGIAITRFHAFFMMNFFGREANDKLPYSMKKVESLLKKNHVVFCGALRQTKIPQTTDATAARIASYLKCPFINLTNVKGIFSENPKINKNAKFIKNISWKDFNKIAKKIKFSAGQHFVLDQRGSEIIYNHKIPTYIVGSLNDISKIIEEKKKYAGSYIYG
jgi:uridylate kinase